MVLALGSRLAVPGLRGRAVIAAIGSLIVIAMVGVGSVAIGYAAARGQARGDHQRRIRRIR